MKNFFSYFDIPYSSELDTYYEIALKKLNNDGDSILNFEKLGIFTYMKEHLCEIRDEIKKDERNILYCYFLNSLLKSVRPELIATVCRPKFSEKSEIFDCLPLFSLLYEVPAMCARLEERNIPQDVIEATCNMFENQMQDFIDLNKHYGISTYTNWMLSFINNKIIRVGRFNIELSSFGNYYVYKTEDGLKIYEEADKSNDKFLVAEPGDPIINLHIPSGGKLDFDENTDDLIRAAKIVSTSFGEFKLFYCSSWLLDPEIERILGRETNMTRFAKRFERFPIENDGKGVFEYLYLTSDTENLETLPETTSMQRAIKKHLQSGKKILDWQGVFSFDDLTK